MLVAALCLVGWRSMVDAPAAAGGTGFSATAAHATLGELLREGKPHPVGSAQNAVVRDRILASLRAAGYEPTVRAKLHCASFGCSQVENIVAVRAGTTPGAAVLATAHYDSVPAGPGAADDGSGTAILIELARWLAKRPPPRNDIILMISDSEEAGLTGAYAFAADPELARVKAVVNLEARGASGPSVMFETGAGNAALMELYADAVPYPVANSLAFEIYKRLPNNTDFTVYRDRGIVGFNLAFVGNASLYHSPHDDLAHLSLDTLQHHGDNAFALVGALAAADLTRIKADGDASYFDLFGRVLIRWPAGLNLPIAAGSLLALLALLLVRRRELRAGAMAWSLLITVVTLPVLFGVGWLLSFPLGLWPGALLLDHPAPWPARIALVAAALLCSVLLGAVAAWRKAGLYGGWLALALAAVATSALVPGGAYAFLWPVVIFVVLSWALGRWPRGAFWASAVGAAVAALFWIGHLLLLESAVGFSQSAVKMLVLAPLVWTGTALWARVFAAPGARAVIPATLAGLVTVGAAALAVLQPTSSPDRPRGLNFVYHANGTAPPRWTLHLVDPGARAPSYLSAHGFGTVLASHLILGVFPDDTPQAPAKDLGLPAPSFEGVTVRQVEGRTVLTGKLRFSRDAFMAGLTVGARAGLLSASLDGQVVWAPEVLRDGQSRNARMGGLADRELTLELTLAPGATGPIAVYQRLPLPDTPETRAMTSSRPADTLPFGTGDNAAMVTQIWPRAN